ncbi:hypothetical protein LKO27_07670 [Tessaracoccus sp. OS52]|uniref:hypothetical protein n=1 Tax=Tessaracoccus sp. OS52 TaxID=2886691 RepID=UPI001D104F68|nr:hypothetical protein [Tessaracoccus sp. OS52]MCC2593286.1 hypothetical protein [Tessaracoccus sp. OS52]
MPTFFEELAADRRRVALDCDVMLGHWPQRADLDLSPDAVATVLTRAGIDGALVASGQAVMFDEEAGNAEARTWAAERDWLPCHVVNLRDASDFTERVVEWIELGVRAIRLPGVTQMVPVTAPGYQLVVAEAARHGLVMLAEGNFTAVQHAFRGIDAKVVFLDMGYYETADFLIAARAEPGFVASTRRLLGPDTLEIVCSEVGARHIAFGSGSPLQDLEPTVWRLRDARLGTEDFDAIAGGTLTALLEN